MNTHTHPHTHTKKKKKKNLKKNLEINFNFTNHKLNIYLRKENIKEIKDEKCTNILWGRIR